MSTKGIALMTAMMMAAAASGRNPYFETSERRERYRQQREKHFKERAHKMYGEDRSEHEFVIHGETILAHDRKTALKIYANRHPESKKRKR